MSSGLSIHPSRFAVHAKFLARHLRFPVLLLAALAYLTLPAPAQKAPASLSPKALKLYPDTPRGIEAKPLADAVFPETQSRQVISVEFDPGAAGRQIDAVVVSVRTTAGLEQIILSASGKVDKRGRLAVELKLPPGRSWPVGYYDIRLGIDQRLIGSMPYRVRAMAPRNTPIKAASPITIARPSDDGTQLLVTSEPKSNQRNLNFILDTTGARTEGARVTWTLTAVKTAAGESINIGSNTVENWPLENTRLNFDVNVPGDWPAGKYNLDVRVDDQLLSALQFDIKP